MNGTAARLFLILSALFLIAGALGAKLQPAQGITVLNDHTRIRQRIDIDALTGRNRTENDSIQTGDATVEDVQVGTFVNTTVIECCTTPNPTPTGSQQQPTPTPEPGNPTPTPTSTPSNGGGNGGGNGSSGDNGGGDGVGGGDVSGVTTSQGEVLGLAATHSYHWPSVFQGVGILCLGLGLLSKRRARA